MAPRFATLMAAGVLALLPASICVAPNGLCTQRATADAQDSQAPGDQRIVDRALIALADEALAAKSAIRFEHPQPDFRTRFGSDITPADLATIIVQRQHDDPFIDAYIRWQLTSFDPPLPEMDDATFLRMLDATPAMVENPKAALDALDTAAQLDRAGRLTAAQTLKLRAYVESLNERTMMAEEMNRPALEWRLWMAEKLGEAGARPRLWRVEGLAATIMAGWPVSDLKGDISRDFTRSVDDDTFTPEQRQSVILQLSRLIGPGRRIFDDVTYFADGSVEVKMRTSSVDRDDVENWRRRLAGIRVN